MAHVAKVQPMNQCDQQGPLAKGQPTKQIGHQGPLVKGTAHEPKWSRICALWAAPESRVVVPWLSHGIASALSFSSHSSRPPHQPRLDPDLLPPPHPRVSLSTGAEQASEQGWRRRGTSDPASPSSALNSRPPNLRPLPRSLPLSPWLKQIHFSRFRLAFRVLYPI